jgi:hypothetical protein
MTKYQIELENLDKACDIAIEAYAKFPPIGWPLEEVEWSIKCRKETKNGLKDRKSPFNNLSSLKYEYQDIFTYFQEGSGQTVEEFWKRIKEVRLPYKRENKLAKILKRGKVRNNIEYDFVKDVLNPYLQDGIISETEAKFLDAVLGEFEQKTITKSNQREI